MSRKSSVAPDQPSQAGEEVAHTIETAPFDYQDAEVRDPETETLAGSLPWSIDRKTQEENWYCSKGYIPSVDSKTLEIIRAVLGIEPALEMARLTSTDKTFPTRLSKERNVHLEEHPNTDTYKAVIDEITLNLPENREVAEVYSRLWMADIENCRGENEAIFQRTIMMSFLDRYRLIFGDIQRSESGSGEQLGKKLAFSVEAEWACDPMPTRALTPNTTVSTPFLAAPKPDLCISFRREVDLIPESLWDLMPPETSKLVCYEGEGPPFDKRAFGFFVVEGKKSRLSPDDRVALYQALNDASQALHNMFEFFRQAEQEDIFFKNVRFFSATTTEKGLKVRIHRAERIKAGSGAKMPIYADPPYDLEFKYEEYASFLYEEFNRQNVINTFAKIMVGYGEGKLYGLLRAAAQEINKRLKAYSEEGTDPASKINDHRHGQKRRPTQNSSRDPSQNEQSDRRTGRGSILANELPRQAAENSGNRARLSRSGTEGVGPASPADTAGPFSTGVSVDFSRMLEDKTPNRKRRRKS